MKKTCLHEHRQKIMTIGVSREAMRLWYLSGSGRRMPFLYLDFRSTAGDESFKCEGICNFYLISDFDFEK